MGRKAPSPGKKRAVREDQEGCKQTSHLISLKVRRMLEITSGLHKLVSVAHKMSIKLESEFLDALQIKAETLQRNQSVRNVSNTPYT